MKRYIFACGISAALGAALAVLMTNDEPLAEVAAQERLVTPLPRPDVVAANEPLRGADGGFPEQWTPEEQVNIAVYERANRSVVYISTKSRNYDTFFLFETPSEGAGSGSVLDKQGHILTGFHVVDGARQIEVTLASGNVYPASLKGRDVVNDVAVLKIDAPPEELYPIEFGDSSSLRIGQRVFVIGNPFGWERTLTTGVVSSLDRTLPSRRRRRTMNSIVQVDAAMNPGNSGGPLLDTNARVIGMSLAIAGRTGQNSGVGFAIPANRIKRMVPDLIRYGKASRPDIGITIAMQSEKGLLIATMAADGPAEQAGLRGFRTTRRKYRQGPFVYERETIDRSTADLITAIDGHPIRTADDLLGFIDDKKPGEEVVLTIVREGQELQVPIRLRASEPQTE